MNLSNLKRASDFDVKIWLEKELKLTEYQKSLMNQDTEFFRDSPFYFYEPDYNRSKSLVWRFSIIFFLIFLMLLFCFLPIKWVFTGKWGYGRSFMDFYNSWKKKIGIY